MMMPEEILPGLYRLEIPLPDNPLKYVNSYVILGAERNLIVDTGLNRQECLDAMHHGLAALDVDLERTDFFITHLHADHFGLVGRLVTGGGRVYFSRPESEIIESWTGWEPMIAYAANNGFPEEQLRKALESHPGFKYAARWTPDLKKIEDGAVITVNNFQFECLTTPGHTQGHVCLYEPHEKLLISGDHILGDITPNIQCWSDNENPLKNYLSSLDRVARLEVDLVLPGHRSIITDMAARIRELKMHHTRRLAEVVEILTRQPDHAFNVAGRMTWDLQGSWESFPLPQKWFATAEATAHLRWLEEDGRITRKPSSDLIVYEIVN
jgi:glyoxylase-like metal-dependent hydrolase (beta-lactamase superfamily II)